MQSAYIVSFELATPTAVTALLEGIKSYGFYCPINSTCWAIKTDHSAVTILNRLSALVGANDRIFVIRSGTEAAWHNSYGAKHDSWLQAQL
jgi:hypothetical protein